MAEGPSTEGPATEGRVARLKERAAAAQERVEAARTTIPAVDAAYIVRGRDVTVGGNLLASAIAYRLFLWILPLALVLTAGLGFLQASSSDNPSEVAHDAGLSGYVTSVVSSAAEQAERSRWIILVIGLWGLYSASSSAAKTFLAVYGLVWGMSVRRPRSTAKSAGAFAGITLATLVVTGGAYQVRRASPGLGVGATVAIFVVYAAMLLLASVLLPHGDAPWYHLLPGAAFAAFGAQVLHLVTVFYLSGRIRHSSALYGGLGAAAAILLWLYLIGRLLVGAAVVNSTLWERWKLAARAS